jgi:hypothetical protein
MANSARGRKGLGYRRRLRRREWQTAVRQAHRRERLIRLAGQQCAAGLKRDPAAAGRDLRERAAAQQWARRGSARRQRLEACCVLPYQRAAAQQRAGDERGKRKRGRADSDGSDNEGRDDRKETGSRYGKDPRPQPTRATHVPTIAPTPPPKQSRSRSLNRASFRRRRFQQPCGRPRPLGRSKRESARLTAAQSPSSSDVGARGVPAETFAFLPKARV